MGDEARVIDWRKIYPRPHPDAVWCDECLRWETGDGRFDRVKPSRLASALEKLAKVARWPGEKVAAVLGDCAERLQVRANIKNGVFHARKP